MDRKYINDHQIVARYLADQLSDAERQSFEAYYLEHPELVQDMEAVARLKVGLMRLEESGELDALIKAPRPFRNYYVFAAAAAIVAAVALVFLFVRQSPQRVTLAASAATLVDRSGMSLPVTTSVRVVRMRGGTADAEIDVTDRPQAIELLVLPDDPSQSRTWRVELSSAGSQGRILAALGNLPSRADDFVPIYIDASQLAEGTYILSISGESAASASSARSDFRISLTRESPPDR